ncbi:ubiquitin-conjugating enzyme E2-binding protein [Bisporella sp. PMI_857]|nr:ubiquitin-conjugating enzyme E2-binding protein [Bisporella sp. PMI_857]
MPPLRPFIYAELLPNIRQISIIATVEPSCDNSTEVKLSLDRKTISLEHRWLTSILLLPGQIAASAVLKKKPDVASKELTWRLPLAGEPTRGKLDTNDAPWPAQSLRENTELFCRGCDELILAEGSIVSWRDLPSENWAEMMDFWHCHKPSEHGQAGHSHSGETKGYGANKKFTARQTVGFVDLTTFLLSENDCQNITVIASDWRSLLYQPLSCTKCKEYIGHIDKNAEGYRLYKWRLNIVSKASATYYGPSTSSIITAQLQSIMSAQCCSKVLLLPMTYKSPAHSIPPSESTDGNTAPSSSSPTTVLHFWVLSPTIRYSSTARDTKQDRKAGDMQDLPASKLAMKIFWKRISGSMVESLVGNASVEEVFLPEETIAEIHETLRESADFLPASARKFQDWDVGLLERFEGEPGMGNGG